MAGGLGRARARLQCLPVSLPYLGVPPTDTDTCCKVWCGPFPSPAAQALPLPCLPSTHQQPGGCPRKMVERSHTRRPGDSWHSRLSGALGSDLLDEQDAGLQLPDGMHKQLPADEIEVILWLQRQNPREFSPQGSGIAGAETGLSWEQWGPLPPPNQDQAHCPTVSLPQQRALTPSGQRLPPLHLQICSPSSWAHGCPARHVPDSPQPGVAMQLNADK